ncbi:MAG: hypothetical protein HKN35_00710 [Woeseia sp.]|nr:hypothetical protein [Woeseia sp.]NNE59397.1 hypothetical protein [Woeseia sp.]NNL53807.1 hypothetical protein [Woeseia sp.]
MKRNNQEALADKIFLAMLIVGLLIFSVSTTQLGPTARAVPVWVLIATAITLVASLVEGFSATGKHKYRFQRPALAQQAVKISRSQSLVIDALLFLSAPLLIYGLGFAFGGTAFVLAYIWLKQRMSTVRMGLLGASTCAVLAGLEWLYLNLLR